ncbi:MAG: SDR family oxidoreductase [Xanthomonadales bacterium]|nr:SDR family oxidoreductase [Gammaproteobacteria bacterium]NNJ64699.1 SDR family oxidoreductase [Xanthomonadales bacterium]NNK31617.1 SDR family oxidoreductase [Xanthomonadales bacterium]
MNTSAKNNGKWALVTGASAGIGAEFCRQLAGQGYSIVLTARREGPMQALLDELRESHGVDGRVLPADLSRPDAVNGIVTALSEAGIPVEFLVNNAGYGVSGEFNEPDWRVHKDFLTVMLDSVCELTWRLLPGMQARGRGYIVNVASLAGLVPGAARNTLYGATKAFLVRFSESLAMENEETGVSVSALCPGFTYSEFHDVLGIRDQVSQMPGWMWMDAPEVVRYGIDSVMRDPPRIVAVPGRANRFIAMLSRKLPMRTTQAMTQRQSRRWRKQD